MTTDVITSKFDVFKLFLAVVFLAAGIFGFHYFAEESTLYRVLALLGIIIVCFLIIYQTAVGKYGWDYIQESRTELRKVVWPTKNETIQTTMIVCFLVLLVGAFIWLVDLGIGWGIGKLLGLGS